MSEEVLEVNDPIHVEVEGELLEGVIAYINKEDEVIGVRLMGSSIRKGTCDGIYEGEKNFSTGAKGAIYVERKHIKKRKLSRFEQLKLKRELMKMSDVSLAPHTASISSSSSSSSRIPSFGASTKRLSIENPVRGGSRISRKLTPESSKLEDKNAETESSSSARRNSNISKYSPLASDMRSVSSTSSSIKSTRIGSSGSKLLKLTPESSTLEDKKAESSSSARRNSNISKPSPSASDMRSVSSTASSIKSTRIGSSGSRLLKLTPESSTLEDKKAESSNSIRLKSSISKPSPSASEMRSVSSTASSIKSTRIGSSGSKLLKLTPESSKLEDKKAENSNSIRLKSSISKYPPSASNMRSVSSTSSSIKSTSVGSSGSKQLIKQRTAQRSSIEKQPSLEQKDILLNSLKLALKETEEEKEHIQEQFTITKTSLLSLINTFSTFDDNNNTPGESSLSSQDDTMSLVHQLRKIINSNVSENLSLQSKLHTLENEAANQKSNFQMKINSLSSELHTSHSQCISLEKQINSTTTTTVSTKSSQYNNPQEDEIINSLQKRIDLFESSKIDTETMIEHLAIEKEQLLEKNEILQDRVEELTIDLESVQVEMEELKFEVEDVKFNHKSTLPLPTEKEEKGYSNNDISNDEINNEDNDIFIQNDRLRDALLILRDEKMLLEQDLEDAQINSANKVTVDKELETMKLRKDRLEIEVQELKEMVDEGSAYEKMVEELSDRVLHLEYEVNKHKSTVKEMEEGADIAAETEEELFLENKSLASGIENKNSIIQTLHEAIKILRDREEHLHIDINKYRTTVETLKYEKTMITNMHHGEEGAKNNLISTSQKALDRVAKLVQDIGELRKKDSMAIFDKINLQVSNNRCEKLESFLPSNVVATDEINVVRGETMLSKIAVMTEVALSSIDSNFDTVLSKNDYVSASSSTHSNADDDSILVFTDEALHQLKCILNETTFSLIIIKIRAEAYRVLCAFQWPEFLNLEFSSKLATALIHPLTAVDFALCHLLRLFIEEKSLNPQLCDLTALSESLHNTQAVISELKDSHNKLILPQDWNPPGLKVIYDLFYSKFLTFGSLASLVPALCTLMEVETRTPIKNLLESKLAVLQQLTDQISCEIKKWSIQMAELPFQDSNLISAIFEHVLDWKNKSEELFKLQQSIDLKSNVWELVEKSVAQVQILLRSIKKVSNVVREKQSATLDGKEKKIIKSLLSLTSEPNDVWENVVQYVSDFTNVDRENMNYQIQARNVRQNISKAFSNESKLVASADKILEMEKSLSSRSKEVSLLNVRVGELVKLKDSTSQSVSNGGESLDEIQKEVNKLKEENLVLSEDVEIWYKKTKENEKEIRLLKDTQTRNTPSKFSTPRRQSHNESKPATSIDRQIRSPSIVIDVKSRFGSPGSISTSKNLTTPRRSQNLYDMPSKPTTSGSSVNEHTTHHIFSHSAAMEAALFRPSLYAARREMEHWKGEAIRMSLTNMVPLHVPNDSFGRVIPTTVIQPQDGETCTTSQTSSNRDSISECKEELRLALHNLRMTKISIKLPDMTKDIPLRIQFQSEQTKMKSALNRLEEVSKKGQLCLARN